MFVKCSANGKGELHRRATLFLNISFTNKFYAWLRTYFSNLSHRIFLNRKRKCVSTTAGGGCCSKGGRGRGFRPKSLLWCIVCIFCSPKEGRLVFASPRLKVSIFSPRVVPLLLKKDAKVNAKWMCVGRGRPKWDPKTCLHDLCKLQIHTYI